MSSSVDPAVTTAINKVEDLARDVAALRQRIEVVEAAFGVPPPPELRVSARPASVLLAKSLGRAGATRRA